MTRQRVVFVTRKFPPQIGGMELLSKQIVDVLSEAADLEVIALKRSQAHLLWFLPFAAVRAAWLLSVDRDRQLVLGDGVVLAGLLPVAFLWGSRCHCLVMGLDLTYRAPGYRALVRMGLRSVARILAISRATAREAQGLAPGARVELLRLGVAEPPPMDRRVAREALCAAHGIAPDCAILVSVGRLEARKGIDWFIREVLPLVEDEVVFLVAGSGPREPAIRQASEALARRGQVRFLGRVTEHEKNVLMSGADVFVMPNISVPGDMEGFGLVAIEAAMRGTPVLGADLEGIRDSVIPSKTGWLVEAQDPEVFAEVVRFVAQNRAEMEQRRISIRNYAAAHFSLDAMRQSLLESLGIQDGSADTTGDDDPR